MPIISLTLKEYGFIGVTTSAMDLTITKYLPASPLALRQLIIDRAEVDPGSIDITTALMMLADFDHNIDSSPFSVDKA